MRALASVLAGAVMVAACGSSPRASAPAATTLPVTQAPAATTLPVTQAPATAAPVTGAPPIPGSGTIPAGTYSFDKERGITIDIPAGWEGCCADPAFVVTRSDVAGIAYERATGMVVYGDACHWKTAPSTEPKTAAALAEAFSGQVGHQGTEPVAASVGGKAGWHVRLTVPIDQEVGGAEQEYVGCDEGEFRSWGGVGVRFHQGPGQVDDLYIVDTDDGPVVFDVISGPGIPDADRAELDAMLASITFS